MILGSGHVNLVEDPGDKKWWKARNKATNEFTQVKRIEDEQGVVFRDLDRILERWQGYFNELLNQENPRFVLEDGGQMKV